MTGRMTYEDATGYLFGLQKYGIKFGLNKTSNLLRAFGDPHKGKKYIHIAGSNGKGSVGAMIESVLVEAGLRVGFYSSPHLVRFTERFRINRQEISREEVAELTEEFLCVIDPKEPPTFFEVTTAMALVYFARKKTDISIMEVGMGGRLDATNVITPLVSVITNISKDHQFFLGSRIMDIAGEKAGIIKEGVELVTGVSRPDVVGLFQRICREKKAPFLRVGKDVRYRASGLKFNYYGLNRNLSSLRLGLRGGFQYRNAALALATIEVLERKGLPLSSEEIRRGLEGTLWPGRLHVVGEEPLIILDGAHNPQAVKEMVDAIRSGFNYERLILVLGVMGDKDIKGILQRMVPVSDYVIYTRPDYYRSARPEDLMRGGSGLGSPGEVVPVIARAIDRARELANPRDLVLITGSLFTVGEAMIYFFPETTIPDES
ncbi:MAG: bifunctional folylpolyglutamate synthase/dihydrofolate synthase [Deltaproteobacteria bacterium]|nr:bifunctional folylpolyglutamate synthase/dihydrofolate synthase [Deltaproteobacteria bacterium]MBW2136487.1 bifunctional folylpolyglutamate synthase/dihydrofolate synthase [Deltaproteobacteria bacterium]